MKDEPAVFALVVFGGPSRKVADETEVTEVVVAFENPAAAGEFARARRVGDYAVAPLGFIATAVPTVPPPRPAMAAVPAMAAPMGFRPSAVPAALVVSAGHRRPAL